MKCLNPFSVISIFFNICILGHPINRLSIFRLIFHQNHQKLSKIIKMIKIIKIIKNRVTSWSVQCLLTHSYVVPNSFYDGYPVLRHFFRDFDIFRFLHTRTPHQPIDHISGDFSSKPSKSLKSSKSSKMSWLVWYLTVPESTQNHPM